ncbi:MAG TPA: hypothetical protein VL728_13625 [Cyclobacteriaceae bacterium]|nr:hypothetical protein [Cyclobacteriaceae bacterium]
MDVIALLRRYALAFVLVAFIGYYFYQQGREDAEFKQKIREIEQIRRSLEDSVKVVKERTAARDENLRKLILRDLQIIDTLNHSLKKLNSGSREIERKIIEHKTKIDELWKNSL